MDIANLKQAINARQSVRSFDGEKISVTNHNELKQFAADAITLFSATDSRIAIVDIDTESSAMTTYGVIGGCRSYLVLISASKSRSDRQRAAAAMELCVLEATRLGLATCWIGSTFRRSVFSNVVKLNSGEEILAIVAVGKNAKSRFVDRLMQTLTRSRERKEPSQLFFNENLQTPIAADSPELKALEYLRAAPSSTNSQPWRVIKINNSSFDLCSATDGRYTDLDMGIAMAHLAVAFAPAKITFDNHTNSYPRLLSISRFFIDSQHEK